MAAYYENQVIGKFLFDFGYYVGDAKKKTAGTVNLFQQTPLDPALSDLLIGADSRFFLLEFKQKGKAASEARKKGIRSHVYRKLDTSHYVPVTKSLKHSGYSYWAEVSRYCHYVCISDPQSSEFIPYTEHFFPGRLRSSRHKVFEYASNREFITHGIYGDSLKHLGAYGNRAGLPRDQFKAYLRVIQGQTTNK